MICSSHFGDGCREETSLMRKAKMGFNTEFRRKADAVPVAIIKAPSASTRAEPRPHAGNFIPTPTTVVYDYPYEESKSETYKSKSKKTTKNLKKEKKNAKKLKGKAKSNVRPTLQQTAKTALKRKEQSLVDANMETTTVTEETKKLGCSRPKRMHRGRQCLVGGCGNFDINGFIIYCLPEHSALVQRRWLKFVHSTRASCGDSRLKDGKKVFVCSGHFKAEDYEQTQIEMYRRGFRIVPPRLKENAIPTVQEARLPFQRDLLHQVATQVNQTWESPALIQVVIPADFASYVFKEILSTNKK